MTRQKLTRLALYGLQALLWFGVISAALAILGGMSYLDEASRSGDEDMWSEVFRILKNVTILVALATSFLYWIGTVRTYMARKWKAEQS